MADRKIISIFTGKPAEDPHGIEDFGDLHSVDKGAVALLKRSLKLAEAGKLCGVSVIGLQAAQDGSASLPYCGTSDSVLMKLPLVVVEGVMKVGAEGVLDAVYGARMDAAEQVSYDEGA